MEQCLFLLDVIYRWAVVILSHKVDTALYRADPVQKAFHHFRAFKALAMLGHNGLYIHFPNHIGPQAAYLLRGNIAPVKANHVRNVLVEIGYRKVLVRATHRRAQVSRKQDFRNWIVKLNVAHRVHEMGG